MDLTLFIVVVIIIIGIVYIINIISDIKTDIRTLNGNTNKDEKDDNNMKGLIDKIKMGLEYFKYYL
jgi:hypothetical protein